MKKKEKLKILIVLVSLNLLPACGAQKAIDSTIAMKEKMDVLVGRMDETNKSMERMSSLMEKTVNGVQDQQLLIPLKELLNKDNYDALTPFPYKLMPWGEKLAQIINSEDMTKLAFLWLKFIDSKKTTELGEEVPPLELSKVEVQTLNQEKLGLLRSLQIMSAFLPQKTVEEIVQKQILSEGRFKKTALSILMMRVQFLGGILLEQSLLAEPFNDIGSLRQAVAYSENIDYICKLPFNKKIRLKIIGFYEPLADLNMDETLDVKVASNYWLNIKNKMKTDLKLINSDSLTGDPVKDQEQLLKNQNEAKELSDKIEQHLKN